MGDPIRLARRGGEYAAYGDLLDPAARGSRDAGSPLATVGRQDKLPLAACGATGATFARRTDNREQARQKRRALRRKVAISSCCQRLPFIALISGNVRDGHSQDSPSLKEAVVAPDTSPQTTLGSADAVDRVLTRERQVEEAVRNASAAAERRLAEARAEAERIRRRADDWIARLHIAADRRVTAEIARMRQEFEDSEAALASEPRRLIDRDALARAIRELSAEMTGQSDEEPR